MSTTPRPPRLMRSTLRLTTLRSEQVRALAKALDIEEPEHLAELLVNAGIVAFALNRCTPLPPGRFAASDRGAVVRLTVTGESGITRELTDEQNLAIVNACRKMLGFPT